MPSLCIAWSPKHVKYNGLALGTHIIVFVSSAYTDCGATLYSAYYALAQMVACLPLVQQVRGSIPSGVVNFNLKIFNLGDRRGGDVHFLIARLYITGLD